MLHTLFYFHRSPGNWMNIFIDKHEFLRILTDGTIVYGCGIPCVEKRLGPFPELAMNLQSIFVEHREELRLLPEMVTAGVVLDGDIQHYTFGDVKVSVCDMAYAYSWYQDLLAFPPDGSPKYRQQLEAVVAQTQLIIRVMNKVIAAIKQCLIAENYWTN